MTNKEKVQALKNKGYDVKYVTRTDGSIRITKITGNGVNIKSSSSSSVGNNAANRILGITANQKAIQQRLEAKQQADRLRRSHVSGEKLTSVEKKTLRKLQAKLRAINKRRSAALAGTGGTPYTPKTGLYFKGKLSSVEWRKIVKREGLEKALSAANNLLTHMAGYSYVGQVEALLAYIEERAFKLPQSFIDNMRIGLEPFIKGEKLFIDEDLSTIYDYIYTMVSDDTTSADKLDAEKKIYRILANQYNNPTKI